MPHGVYTMVPRPMRARAAMPAISAIESRARKRDANQM
jgi:hypothetical protein